MTVRVVHATPRAGTGVDLVVAGAPPVLVAVAGTLPPPAKDEHVRAEAAVAAWVSVADVVVEPAAATAPAARGQIVVRATPGTETVSVRGAGWRLEVSPPTGRPGELGSFVHWWLVSGGEPALLDGRAIRIQDSEPTVVRFLRTG